MVLHAEHRGLVTHDPAGRPLRVALVTSSYNFIADGVALTLNRLVGFLQSRGVEVLIFAPVSKTPAFAHQGEIVAVPSAPLPLRSEYRLAFGLPRAQRERLRAFDPDIVHIAVPDLLGHQALRFALELGRPVVASYHTRYETYFKYYGLDMLRGAAARIIARFYASCREVYVPSISMADVLGREIGRDKIHLWQRGVDTARFNPAKRSEPWRASVGLGPDEVVVAFVSRLVREKRVATVVEVLNRLSAAGIPHRGLFVGDGPERTALRNAAPDAVFTGHLGGEELAVAYASSDIFIFPSDTETFGSVTLEAMASGLPTVCADATGSRSLVEQGVTGYLLEPGDGAGFFEHVRLLAIEAERRSAMGGAARERSLRFSWDEAMGGLLGRYQALAGEFDADRRSSLVAA
jgi:glycosyltransferase involved in cell wall biosynthesis